jgi:hypothetical protein
MTWIPLLKQAGYGYNRRGSYGILYECQLCHTKLGSSERAAHGRRHQKRGEAVLQDRSIWTPRGRLEWNIYTDDPALEQTFPRYRHLITAEPTVASLIKVGT